MASCNYFYTPGVAFNKNELKFVGCHMGKGSPQSLGWWGLVNPIKFKLSIFKYFT